MVKGGGHWRQTEDDREGGAGGAEREGREKEGR
jgi:hypothetical protein